MTNFYPYFPVLISILFFATPVSAAVTASGEIKRPAITKNIVPEGVSQAPYIGAIAIDPDSGTVFASDHADRPGYPASTTKLMTLLLILEDIENGKISLSDRITASKRASSVPPSSVAIKPGESMTVDDLLKSIMVKSANDAAIMLAEHSAGTVEAFVERMNSKAAELGMRSTKFASPNGLSPKKGEKRDYDISTAGDLCKLAVAVLKREETVKYTSLSNCTVTNGAGKPLTLWTHNPFLKPHSKYREKSVTGLKTGYTNAAGSSIVLSAYRNGHRTIVVVLGSSKAELRDRTAKNLLNEAFAAQECWGK